MGILIILILTQKQLKLVEIQGAYVNLLPIFTRIVQKVQTKYGKYLGILLLVYKILLQDNLIHHLRKLILTLLLAQAMENILHVIVLPDVGEKPDRQLLYHY
jgi:hypothetical protein